MSATPPITRARFLWQSLRAAVPALALLAVFTKPAAAQGVDFLPADGLFDEATNWSGGLVPTSANFAQISGGRIARVEAGDVLTVNVLRLGHADSEAGTVIQTGGDFTTAGSAGTLILGSVANGIGIYELSGGNLTVSNTLVNAMSLGFSTGSQGSFTQTGGVAVVAGGINVGNASSSIGNLNISAGTLSVSNINATALNIGSVATASGTYNQTGGTVTVVGGTSVGNFGTGEFNISAGTHAIGGNFNVAQQAGSTGTVNISGTGELSASNTSAVGRRSAGVLNISGGSYSQASAGFAGTLFVGDRAANSNALGTINHSAGTLNVAVMQLGKGFNAANTSTSGIYHLSGTAEATIRESLIIGASSANSGLAGTGLSYGRGEFNLDGGTLIAPRVRSSGDAASVSTFNFNGGTLRASTNQAQFLEGLTTVNVQAGGAVIDSAGFNITINQALLDGGGGLTKTGAGTLTLGGANAYGGATTVAGGTLRISGNARLGNTNTTITISNAGVLEVTAAGTLTNAITAGAGHGVLFNSSAGALVVAGNVVKDGTVFTSRSGSGTNIFTGVISGASANSDFVVDGGTTVFSNAMTYNGPTIVINGGTLNLGTTDAIPTNSALRLGTNATAGTVNLQGYHQTVATLETVGTAGTNNLVTLGGGTLTISGDVSTTYAGAITGDGTVAKNGAGTLTLSGSVTATNLRINGGTVALGANNVLGDTLNLDLNGGTFIVGSSGTRYTDSLGTLTLSADSTIDMGASGGLGTITFANSAGVVWATNAVLTITNWQGATRTQSEFTKLLFGTGGLSSAQLAQIRFADQDITGGVLLGNDGELAPIPEAPVWMGALAVCAFIGWHERARLRRLLAAARFARSASKR